MKKNLQSKILAKPLYVVLSFTLVASCFSIGISAQEKSTSGKTTASPFLTKNEKPYLYEPIDPRFWNEVEDNIEDKNFLKVIEDGLDLTEEFGADSDDAIEGMLAVGVALRHLKLSYAATVVLKEVALKRISSELAQKALYELSLIDKDFFLDPVDIVNDFLNSNEFGNLHPDVQSFVSHHTSMSDLINGFRDWSKIESSKVQANSYWAAKTHYLKAINEVTQGKLDDAEARFSRLVQNPDTHSKLKDRAKLHIARISFEKKDFIKAASIYEELKDFPLREKGRILLERAWTNYYLKNLSESLGILQGLKSPTYMVSASPERYILEMIIYKQLCYFEKVSEVAKEYYAVFGQAIKDIRKRRDLTKNVVASQFAMANMRLQEQANFINQLRDEVEQIKEMDLNDYKYFKEIESWYKNKDQELQKRLFFMLDKTLPQVSEEILDSEEQVKFLDYTAKLDALRIVKKGEERSYRSEKISYVKFDKVYWPVEEEYWIDELDDYEVLIRSQCDLSMPSSATDEQIIREFGEEFR